MSVQTVLSIPILVNVDFWPDAVQPTDDGQAASMCGWTELLSRSS